MKKFFEGQDVIGKIYKLKDICIFASSFQICLWFDLKMKIEFLRINFLVNWRETLETLGRENFFFLVFFVITCVCMINICVYDVYMYINCIKCVFKSNKKKYFFFSP